VLEKSVLQTDEIPSLLASRYGFAEVSVIAPLDGGTANLWSVQCDDTTIVLKEFQSRYTENDILKEPEINHTLKTHGLPVVSFVKTISNGYIWTYRDRAFHLQELAPGKPTAPNQAPPWLIETMPGLLADVHKTMREIELPTSWPGEWYRIDVDRLVGQYSDLIKRAPGLDEALREEIVADLVYRQQAIPQLSRLELTREKFTYTPSHGDYHLGQLLIADDTLSAIVDFSAAATVPAVWEIIRSFTLSHPGCRNGEIPVEAFIRYVSQYLETSELSQSDIENMLPLYYAQLTRSRYGYREYLNGTEDPERTLNFARWRTRTSLWLRENMANVTAELVTATSHLFKN
jgi:Ser/Thr protein kinase RdoA (MazF antagonist)